jgi:transcriptional regulator with XRE-family HTH domain
MGKKEQADRSELGRILGLMTLSDGRVAAELGVSPATVRSWRTGRRTPSPENRQQLVVAARNHAFTILRLARQMEGGGVEGPSGDGSVTADLGELRRQIDRAGAEAASIRKELEETSRLLARQG